MLGDMWSATVSYTPANSSDHGGGGGGGGGSDGVGGGRMTLTWKHLTPIEDKLSPPPRGIAQTWLQYGPVRDHAKNGSWVVFDKTTLCVRRVCCGCCVRACVGGCLLLLLYGCCWPCGLCQRFR